VVFAVVAIAQFMVVLDTAIINVALPVIKVQLGFADASIQWVVTAYVLAFGGFLLLGGRVADLYGRRRTLVAGMIAFTVLSFLIGIDSSVPLLITLRGLQGVAAAFMSPAAPPSECCSAACSPSTRAGARTSSSTCRSASSSVS
jgi:MFS family permease